MATLFDKIFMGSVVTLLMFGMGLSLTFDDFKRVVKFPKPLIAGLFSQIVLLPLWAAVIIMFLPMPDTIKIGLIILALCPGTVSSNFFTFLAKGNVALAVSLTAVSSFIVLLTLPLFANLMIGYFIEESSLAAVKLSFVKTAAPIVLFVIIPVTIGMVLAKKKIPLLVKYNENLNKFIYAIIAFLLVYLVVGKWETIGPVLLKAGFATSILNVGALFVGLIFAKLIRLSYEDQKTISIETGVQNVTLALVITSITFESIEMGAPSIIYAITMLIITFIFVEGFKRFEKRA